MSQTITYTEPKKETFNWLIIKHEEGKPSIPLEFKTKKDAWDFLTGITVYVDNKPIYKEISNVNKGDRNKRGKK